MFFFFFVAEHPFALQTETAYKQYDVNRRFNECCQTRHGYFEYFSNESNRESRNEHYGNRNGIVFDERFHKFLRVVLENTVFVYVEVDKRGKNPCRNRAYDD